MSRAPITSAANARLRSLAGLRGRAERDRTGRTLVDGGREVGRALDAGVRIEEVLVAPTLARSAEVAATLERLSAAGVPMTSVSEAAFGRIAYGDRGDGIVAVVAAPDTSLERLALPPEPLVVVIEGVEKPGNLGAVLRTADAVGADAVVAADPRTDPWNPNAIRASLGTIFGLPLASAPAGAARAWLEGRGLRLVAARVDGAIAYTELDLTGPLAIVLGSEAGGLSETWRGPGVAAARIPMHGLADSLNVSVAAAVLLFEARRQRDLGGAR